ncbi:Acetyltransferase [Carbonactinospora thermoautotrophica]|uniref:Acetyltransferase n=1 Tax=Carbonactinospora thermoautotrophica TaxID=1469144 RepID=A0A132MS67_9ACTN|nr:GNAT family N-acetyltransferase [Carbonactinospora thermoautotrophica]KWX00707.1 Acetyltransferase [Carbonactinospora thermoautotrophica]
MTDLTLRLGGPDDIPAVALLSDRAEAARRGEPILPDYPETATLEAMEARLKAEGSWLLLAYLGDQPVGAALAIRARERDGAGEVIPGLFHLTTLAVEPQHWGEGVGEALLDRVVEEARSRGAHRLQLWTQADNLRAQLLYERCGFRRTGRTRIDEVHGHIFHYERDV